MDGQVNEEGDPQPVLQNETPQFISDTLFSGVNFIQQYGWFILLGVVILLYLKSKLQPALNSLQKKAEKITEKKYDSSQAEERLQAMEASRRRLQEQLDAQAARHAEQMKAREEEKRQAKIEDWDKHQQGRGYRSKYRPQEEPSTSSAAAKPKPKTSSLRNQDYNPLTGEAGGSCAWRPGSRRPTGGG